MSLPQFDPAQFANLAKLILYEHRKLFPNRFPSNTTLEEMLSAILLAQENKLETEHQLRETKILELIEESFSNEDEHIHHSDQNSEIGMQDKEFKIVKRLINAKNETKLQLEHLTNRYNKLLGVMLEVNEKHETLKIELESAQIENKKNVENCVLKDSQIVCLEKQIAKMKENEWEFKKQYSNIKKEQQEISTFMRNHLKNFQSSMVNDISKLFHKYETIITNLTANFTSTTKTNELKFIKEEVKRRELTNLIDELVYDLGEAINFKKKSDEEVQEWIQKYHDFKTNREATEKKSILRSNVMSSVGLSDHAKFIEESRRLLSRYG